MPADGQRFLEEGRFKEALACFAGGDSRSVFGRAVAYQLLGHFDEAEAAYEILLASDPEHQEALANLIAMNVERFDLARVELYSRRLLVLEPDSAIALQGMVVVAAERRDVDLAASYLSRLKRPEQRFRDAIEYRLSSEMHAKLKDHYGPVAHPY